MIAPQINRIKHQGQPRKGQAVEDATMGKGHEQMNGDRVHPQEVEIRGAVRKPLDVHPVFPGVSM